MPILKNKRGVGQPFPAVWHFIKSACNHESPTVSIMSRTPLRMKRTNLTRFSTGGVGSMDFMGEGARPLSSPLRSTSHLSLSAAPRGRPVEQEAVDSKWCGFRCQRGGGSIRRWRTTGVISAIEYLDVKHKPSIPQANLSSTRASTSSTSPDSRQIARWPPRSIADKLPRTMERRSTISTGNRKMAIALLSMHCYQLKNVLIPNGVSAVEISKMA